MILFPMSSFQQIPELDRLQQNVKLFLHEPRGQLRTDSDAGPEAEGFFDSPRCAGTGRSRAL